MALVCLILVHMVSDNIGPMLVSRTILSYNCYATIILFISVFCCDGVLTVEIIMVCSSTGMYQNLHPVDRIVIRGLTVSPVFRETTMIFM